MANLTRDIMINDGSKIRQISFIYLKIIDKTYVNLLKKRVLLINDAFKFQRT